MKIIHFSILSKIIPAFRLFGRQKDVFVKKSTPKDKPSRCENHIEFLKTSQAIKALHATRISGIPNLKYHFRVL